jgi:hypothetical protein
MIEGFSFLAIANKVLIIFYDYPTYFDIISEELIEKKVPFYISVAHALARYVLPVPGGPYNKIPFQGFL